MHDDRVWVGPYLDHFNGPYLDPLTLTNYSWNSIKIRTKLEFILRWMNTAWHQLPWQHLVLSGLYPSLILIAFYHFSQNLLQELKNTDLLLYQAALMLLTWNKHMLLWVTWPQIKCHIKPLWHKDLGEIPVAHTSPWPIPSHFSLFLSQSSFLGSD